MDTTEKDTETASSAKRPCPKKIKQTLSAVVIPTIISEHERVVHNFKLWANPGFFPGSLKPEDRPRLILSYNNPAAASAESEIRNVFDACEPLNECFSGLDFIYLDLSGERDVYIRDYSRKPPPEGFKAGPNNQFFETISRLKDLDGYAFLMETDCIPIRANWLTRLQKIVAHAQPFWIMGSAYRGVADLDPEFARHINGNAIYAVGDPLFQSFINQIWRPRLLKFIREHDPRVAYDIFLDWMFSNEINSRTAQTIKLYQATAHKFVYTDYIQNRSTEADYNFFSVHQTASFLQENPETFLLHGTIFAKAAALFDPTVGTADPARLGVGLVAPLLHPPSPSDARWTTGRLTDAHDVSEWRLQALQDRYSKERAELTGTLERIDADRHAKQEVIDRLVSELAAVDADRHAKQEVIDRLVSELAAVDADRHAKQEVIDRLVSELAAVDADRHAKQEVVDRVAAELAAVDADRHAKQEVIDRLKAGVGRLHRVFRRK